MKKFFGLLALALGFLFASPPTFVNLVPITSLSNTTVALSADSMLLYVVRGNSYGTYAKIRLDTLRSYLNSSSTSYAFLDTITGYTATVTDSLYCTRAGKVVSCRCVAATGTSNATAHSIQHLPAALTPSVAQITNIAQITDTSTVFYGTKITIGTDGTVALTNNGVALKNSGTFAITAGTLFQYQLY
jgi:hypothetical protein